MELMTFLVNWNSFATFDKMNVEQSPLQYMALLNIEHL